MMSHSPLYSSAPVTTSNGGAPSSAGRLLRVARRERRLRQRDLAAAAGISIAYLSEVEHDRARATAPTLHRLAALLDVDANELVAIARRSGGLAPRSGTRGNESPIP